MVDYSKWNKFDLEDTDSEDDTDRSGGGGGGGGGVRVTRLDEPSTVTTNKSGDVTIERQSKNVKSINDLMASNRGTVVGKTFDFDDLPAAVRPPVPPAPTATTATTATAATTSKTSSPSPSSTYTPSSTITTTAPCSKNSLERARRTTNGASYEHSGSELFWSQDEASLTIHAVLPNQKIGAKMLQVKIYGNVQTFKTRTSSVPASDPSSDSNSHGKYGHLSVLDLSSPSSPRTIISGDFSFPVFVGDEDDDDDDDVDDPNMNKPGCLSPLVDWEVVSFHCGTRAVKITLGKASPMKGVVIWWDRLFSSHAQSPRIDVEKIKGRRGGDRILKGKSGSNATGGGKVPSPSLSSSSSSSPSSPSFSSAWEQAHEMFKEKMAAKKKNNAKVV